MVCLCVFLQSAELFTLTYGAAVAQLVRDYETPDEVNKQLDKMYVKSLLLGVSPYVDSPTMINNA